MSRDEKTVELECKLITQTPKAYLVEPTNTGIEIWLPKSQVYDRQPMDEGVWLFFVSEWIATKNRLI